jgi:PAS domain S-box-containing protein
VNTVTLTLDPTLDPALARQMDRLCDAFEDACKSGQVPRIDDYLNSAPEAARPALLRELARLDEYYRTDSAPPAGRERYTFVRPHAEGGIGRVSLHHDRELGRDVALKELHPERAADPAVLSQFLREAQITGQLEHPGIVPVYELARPAPGRPPFYTMRFVHGRTLTEAVEAYHAKRQAGDATPLDLVNLLTAFVAVCQAVAYAHSRSVIHRDLKGRNVVLGDFGEVIVLDWGLAKRLHAADGPEPGGPAPAGAADHTAQGVVKGTPQYMAPEQAAGRVDLIGPRTDVYGLGAILYEVLTGRAPFIGATLAAVLTAVQMAEPPPPCDLVPEVPAALEAACLRALAKDPAARPASATALAGEVQRWLAESAERSRAEHERERFFNLSLDLLCTVGADHRFKQVNPAWQTTLGWGREELVGRPYLEFVHRDDRSATAAEGERALAGEGRPGFENRYRCADGSYRWVSWTASLIPGERLVYAVGRDVTARKQAEEALRRSQERYELAVRGSGDGLWDWDLVTGENYTSPRWKSMLGYDDHELTHALDEWTSRLHPDDRDRAVAALQACADGRAEAYEVEYRLRHKDGSYRWILDRGVALRRDGTAYRMAGSHADITDRKRAEEAVRASEELHRAEVAALTAELQHCREELARRPAPA